MEGRTGEERLGRIGKEENFTAHGSAFQILIKLSQRNIV